MKIAIIGGGWVGCHLATKLKDKHEITIFEKNDFLFNETSFKNQNRLHYGFHYARNNRTRELCKNTFELFINDYGFLVNDVKKNLYCVPKNKSLIDFETYKIIFNDYEHQDTKNSFQNLEGCIQTNEKHIDFISAQKFFNEQLKNFVNKKTVTKKHIKILQKEYDLVINATNNSVKDTKNHNSFFELTISYLYKKNKITDFDALTMVDGEFFSIYPYCDNIFTVTDVQYTPIKKFKTKQALVDYQNKLTEDDIEKRKEQIEKKIIEYYPQFIDDFSYHSYFLSTKSKILSVSDDRYPIIVQDKNLINCFTGKIQGIYIIEDMIKNLIYDKGGA